ncbi:MAG TPA: class II fructose-bisphosphate aldolase [Armatimonadota bacterium]|nr:class II fructose-bisphosphate aldolase [Armatimonadota bacterium]
MPLAKVASMLKDAQTGGYAVAAFNVFNHESISWIIKAAEAEGMPIIAMLFPACNTHVPESTFTAIANSLAAKAKVPVGVHYDHCNKFDQIMAAIAAGFQSVMIDGSALPYEDNVAVTAAIARAAHPMGVSVEAELGLVGRANNPDDFITSSHYTKPSTAVDFIKRTGVDSLAVAIGSAHGNYVTTPKLDLKRLEEIRSVVSTPLVLHGGSGIPEEQIRESVRRGITKLNIGTEFNQESYRQIMALTGGEKAPGSLLGALMRVEPVMVEYVRAKIRMLQP